MDSHNVNYKPILKQGDVFKLGCMILRVRSMRVNGKETSDANDSIESKLDSK